MDFDADILLLAAVVGVLLYGVFGRPKVAGYDQTPPPKQTSPTPSPLPGIPLTLAERIAAIVTKPGGTLPGPVSPKRLDPDRISFLIKEILKRLSENAPDLEYTCTMIDSGTCDADAFGSEQYQIIWILYERTTNTAIQLVSGIITFEDGTMTVTKMSPLTSTRDQYDTADGEIRALERSRHAPYELPISPDI